MLTVYFSLLLAVLVAIIVIMRRAILLLKDRICKLESEIKALNREGQSESDIY